MLIEPGAHVAWIRKATDKLNRPNFLRIDGQVIEHGKPGYFIVQINGSAYEVAAGELRRLRCCIRCGNPVRDYKALYCNRRCLADGRIEDTRQAIWDYLIKYKTEHDGLSPTVRTIAKGVGTDHTSVLDHLRRMEADGLIWYVGEGNSRLIAIKGGRWTFEVTR